MPTIAIDFDGTITRYSGYKGKLVFDLPFGGAKKYINKLRKDGWTIIINTTRKEILDVEMYLRDWGIYYDFVNYNPQNQERDLSDKKVIADVYLDDRNVEFDGDWGKAFEKIKKFKPWWKNGKKK